MRQSQKISTLTIKSQSAKKQYIPPMNHPWRKASFQAFVKKQKHRQSDSFKQSA